MDYEAAFNIALSDSAHRAPESGTFTVEQAHRTMRVHCDCQRNRCERKELAAQTLSDAGEIVFASNYDRRR
jgi:hypothetical protein